MGLGRAAELCVRALRELAAGADLGTRVANASGRLCLLDGDTIPMLDPATQQALKIALDTDETDPNRADALCDVILATLHEFGAESERVHCAIKGKG
jgi:hypothetical protein